MIEVPQISPETTEINARLLFGSLFSSILENNPGLAPGAASDDYLKAALRHEVSDLFKRLQEPSYLPQAAAGSAAFAAAILFAIARNNGALNVVDFPVPQRGQTK